ADRHAVAHRGELEHLAVDQCLEHLALGLGRFERACVEGFALDLAAALAFGLEGLAEFLGADLLRFPGQPTYQPPVGRAAPPRRLHLDLGGIVGAALEQVLLHAEERERNGQERDDDDRDPAGHLVSESLQHWASGAGTSPHSPTACRRGRAYPRRRPRRAGTRPAGRCQWSAPRPGFALLWQRRADGKARGRPCCPTRAAYPPPRTATDAPRCTRKKNGPCIPAGPVVSNGGADGTRTRDLRRDRPAF